LVTAGALPAAGRRNHNIKSHWDRLHAAAVGDEKLRQTIQALKPFVDSLSRSMMTGRNFAITSAAAKIGRLSLVERLAKP
jgi:hypothetical protein